MSVAILQFPGSNCEDETAQALDKLSISYERVPWNSAVNLDRFSGFILPGGFSFQDRIRAGVIAAKLPIIRQLRHESTKGKLILGICNGAQILVEAGLFSHHDVLTDIIDLNYVHETPIGFMCDWGFLRPFNHRHTPFLASFNDNTVLPVQICHGEGRFLHKTPPTSGLVYSRIDGHTEATFPTTPNGATNGLAAISNAEGNAFAIMPHPERSLNSQRYPHAIRAYAKKNHLALTDFTDLFNAFKG
ncbi:MAG: phosphoribosylformylglycinamidine synthase subunit PurQ [Candidatus Marinamargulisbacteria bacterium]